MLGIRSMKRGRTQGVWKLATLAFLSLALLSACGGGYEEQPPPPPEPTSNYVWTWVSGSHIENQGGVYGNKGTADPANVSGARWDAVSWIDSSGKLWLFGGHDDSGGDLLNDLWKFDPATLEWTWVSGSDAANQAGIYGTKGIPDPANVPGARTDAVSWIDSNDQLWLFGGGGLDGSGALGELNDLWKFDPATLEWTWVSGSDTIDQPGVYGSIGIPDPANVPGARTEAVSQIDSEGNLWLFGGYGFGPESSHYYLNDLWKYNPTTLEWTWIAGFCEAHYGTMGKAAASNAPGGRVSAVSWIDSNDRLWLFGGYGYDETLHGGRLNDLWKFDPATLEWTWESGRDYVENCGIYGTKGTAGASNLPGGRYGAVAWIDANDKLWLFGGRGQDSLNYYGEGSLNDLWKCARR